LYNQIQADLAHFKSENEAEFEAWSTDRRNAFDTWFATIQDILDEDTAGHLQNEIEALQGDMNTAKARLGKELTATLAAGSTTLTFTDASITSDTIVDNVLTSVYGVIPENMTISNGSLTLTFEEQATDVGVKVVIR
jgi:hypothetical protein